MTTCPYCRSKNVIDQGIDDSCGDYGDSLGEVYECEDCGSWFDVAFDEWPSNEDEAQQAIQDDLGEIPF